MRAYGPAIAEAARAAAARWAPGRRFSMLSSTQEIALDVIVRVVFGVEGEGQARRMKAAVLDLIDALNPLILLFMWLRHDFGGIGPWARFQRAKAALDALLIDQIRARRASGEARPDILDLLVRVRDEDGEGLSDIELVEQLRALLFAGHETTATVLASALFEIHREPRILERVVSEIDALGPSPEPDALASLPYLEAICYEALRMYPPVVDVGRVTRGPFALGRYMVPAGEAIVPSPLMLHWREDLYPDPDRFKPERFLDWKPSPFEFIAFGGGARRCLGAAFAMYEMKVALGTILAENKLRCAADTPLEHVRRGLTMGPQGGVPMVLETRRRARGGQAVARKAEPSAGAPGCPFAARAGSSYSD
jgi:cytochrome P450